MGRKLVVAGYKYDVVAALQAQLERVRELTVQDPLVLAHLFNQSVLEGVLQQARCSPDQDLRFEFELEIEGPFQKNK